MRGWCRRRTRTSSRTASSPPAISTRAGSPTSPKSDLSGFRLDYNAVGEGPLLLPGQQPHVPRVSQRLDATWLGSEAAHPVDGPLALPVVVHGHLDARGGRDRHRHAGLDEPVQPGGQVPRPAKFKPTDVGLPGYVDDFCSTKGGCMLPLVTIGGYRRPSGAGVVGRRHGHARPGPVERHARSRGAHPARRRRRAPRRSATGRAAATVRASSRSTAPTRGRRATRAS